MTSSIELNFQELAAAESALRAAVTDLEQLHTSLTEYLQPLVATWTGKAAEAYRQAQDEWSAGAAELRTLLTDMHNIAVTAHDNHASAVRVNTAMWRV